MTINQLSRKLTSALDGFLAGEFKVILLVAVSLFIANLAYSAYRLGFTDGMAFEGSRTYTVSGDNTFMIRLRIAVSLGLLVCVAGMAVRGFYGFLASMFGIIWLGFIYGWWYYKSLSFLKNLQVPDFSALPDLSHAAGLRGATWWDLLVLATAAILLVWQAVILIRVMKAPNDWFRSDVGSLP
jgi:hypothetical protein